MRTHGERGHAPLDLVCVTIPRALSAGTQMPEACGKGQVWGIVRSEKRCLLLWPLSHSRMGAPKAAEAGRQLD